MRSRSISSVCKLSLHFCSRWESGWAALCVASNFEIVKFWDSAVGRLAASWGCGFEPWVVRNVSGLPGPSVPGQSVWINDPSPGRASGAEAPDARREASIGLYTQSLLSSEALRVGWGLIINILWAPQHGQAGGGEKELLSRFPSAVGVPPLPQKSLDLAAWQTTTSSQLMLQSCMEFI